MPRGKKNLTLDERLVQVTNEIEQIDNYLKELKKTKKELEEQINQMQLSELNNLIIEKGLSIEELKQMLNNED